MIFSHFPAYLFSIENPYQDEDILDSMNISYIDDKIDMHLPYESSGDNKKDENRTINENHIDIIIEDEMKKNESETQVNDSSWPDSFHEISIDETTDAINRICLIIPALIVLTTINQNIARIFQ